MTIWIATILAMTGTRAITAGLSTMEYSRASITKMAPIQSARGHSRWATIELFDMPAMEESGDRCLLKVVGVGAHGVWLNLLWDFGCIADVASLGSARYHWFIKVLWDDLHICWFSTGVCDKHAVSRANHHGGKSQSISFDITCSRFFTCSASSAIHRPWRAHPLVVGMAGCSVASSPQASSHIAKLSSRKCLDIQSNDLRQSSLAGNFRKCICKCRIFSLSNSRSRTKPTILRRPA